MEGLKVAMVFERVCVSFRQKCQTAKCDIHYTFALACGRRVSGENLSANDFCYGF